ncbi:MAG: MG2 domain-containing protein [Bacteroidota bacterium]|nr:MG2 domain-containing protein [Bacteroidota bacterium]
MNLKKYSAFFIIAFLFSFLFNNSFAQPGNNYDARWKQVEQFVNKGLTKSALDEVTKIYEVAKKDHNDTQIIKALLYQVTLNRNIQEDANVKSITGIEKEVVLSKEPAKSILCSILAEMYWNFFQQNRYKLYNRTKTMDFKKDDIQTWGIDDFHKKIGDLYLKSINKENLLQQTKLESFEAIIIKGSVRYLRPTLFDLLTHRALDYFKSDEQDINRPAYAFEIKDEKAFAPATEFAAHKFINKDSASLHYYALTIFQKLLKFHEADAKPDALIDADIERINFVKQYGVMNNKEDLYLLALTEVTKHNNEASAQALFLIAQEIYNLALQDKTSDDTLKKYSVKQSKKIADAVVKLFPESEGGINAKNLLNQILHKELNLTSEKVNVPGMPFRTLVSYKNFSSLNFRIIEMTPEFKKLIETNTDNDELWKKLTSQKYLRSWNQPLLQTGDYLIHSAEIKVDALPVGQYALLASVAEDFNLNKNPLVVQYFHVSNISYINNGGEYFILNRTTGNPLSGAKVQVWNQRYDYNARKNNLERVEILTADKNGYLKISGSNTIRLEITHQKDKLFLDDYQYTYTYQNAEPYYKTEKEYEDANLKIFLFTDRSIYRPGQLVYFKGIAVTKDFDSNKLKVFDRKDSLTIELRDANYQKIDSVKVSPNDFGSMNGKFRLPENKLNGNFNILVKNELRNFGQVSFSVEEYRRPKFYAEFEKVKGTYRVNEKIKITGFAKAYAGNNIDGANVKYRVTRAARFLYPWMWWRFPMPNVQPLEIAHGEITTNAEGKFTIEFEAIPDLSIDKNTDPVFDYKVDVDVTDVNGETRSANTIVPVGYKSLNLQINISSQPINVDSLKQIFISTKNLSGELEPAIAEVKVYKLQTPQRLIRSRYWPQPDEFVMNKEEFLKYFPNDEYNNENKKETWQKGEMIFSKTDSTNPTTNFNLQTTNFTQGWYIIEATAKDKYGQEVKDVKYFQLYDTKASSLPAPAYTWNSVIKNVAQPGEKAQFISGTSANDIFLIQQVDKTTNHKLQTTNYEFYSLNNEKKTFEFPVTEEDRGGFGVYQFFVRDNRVYTNTWNVSVPWTNKQLDITFTTFRDKTLPGSEEKWKVKISGSKKEKVAAEMLASMYDASLDQFKPHSWNSLNVWPSYTASHTWNGWQNFSSVHSQQKWWNEYYVQQKEKIYDQLIFANSYNNNPRNMKLSSPAMAVQELQSDVTVRGVMNKTSKDEDADKVFTKVEYTLPNGDLFQNGRIVKRQQTNIDQSQIQIRKNFNETAFFFPDLRTDKDGNIEFSFTMPEALTQWKLMTLAHTKDLASGYAERTVVTQKELMVQPFAPRFLREGDKMEFTAKIVNLSDKEIIGQSELQLFNASTMTPVDGWFKNIFPVQYFTTAAGQSTVVKFNIEIPNNFNNAIVYRIIAKGSPTGGDIGGASDGEEAAIPVLTNRMLVTETMPLPVRGNITKNFTFQKLLNSGNSTTLTNFSLTTEFTTNPAWYAVQALPYLMEYPYECAEQTWNRYYANSIATKIVNSSPKIKAVFEKWKITDTSALMSNLQKNEELKSVLLQETPWVLHAQNETQQKKNIALLFDMIRMSNELESSLTKLKDMQASNSGFVWFKGGPDDRYMTQYIVTGIGHLKKLNAYPKFQEGELKNILSKAIPYLDKRLKEDYDKLIKYKTKLDQNNLGYYAIQYLYMRSFFPDHAIAKETQNAYNYYREQSKKYWLSQNKYMQAMIALSLNRTDDNLTPKSITRSLKENSINNEELGMYWKEWDAHSWWWYQAPIESQAMMIEAFSEIDKDNKVVDDLKTWLLKNKQTNNWHTTKATAEACYALLLQGTDWLSEEKNVTIKLGSTTINSKNEKQEAGTGYFKTKIDGDKVKPDMGNVSVTVSTTNQSTNQPVNQSTSWGAIYWQYFENLDKITFAETPLKLSKKLFIEKNSDRGPVLIPVNDGTELKVGDKIKVRIELRVDRDMEYLHMKDMRAACMEPTNVISQYKYQGGLGYYETTKDASTNFFFNYLNKGTYVFEYPMFVTHSGNFSNGVTTIQCMYAPEFTAHSEGVRVNVVE